MTEAQEKFERDCLLLGKFDENLFNSFRTSNSYSVGFLEKCFEGYCISAQAEELRMKALRAQEEIPTSSTLKTLSEVRYGNHPDDVITAPENHMFGYALVTNKMWPEAFNHDTLEVTYTPVPNSSGADYVDVVLIEGPGATAQQCQQAANQMGTLRECFHLKTSMPLAHEGREHELNRLMIMHDDFMELQGNSQSMA